MDIRTPRALGCLLILAALLGIVLQRGTNERAAGESAADPIDGDRQLRGDTGNRMRDTRSRPATREPDRIPVMEWSDGLRNQKARNRQELESRLALLDERIGLSEIQMLNLRSHMEGWYSSMEREIEANGRWSWPDHREIYWSRICGASFVSEEQKHAYRVLSEEVTRQRERNAEQAKALLGKLKETTALAPYQENSLLPFLVAYQIYEQGWGQVEAGAVPWRNGLRAGQFDPLRDLLDPEQLVEISRLLAEKAGPLADAVSGTKSFPPATPEGSSHDNRRE
jgi:hypothetical protein